MRGPRARAPEALTGTAGYGAEVERTADEAPVVALARELVRTPSLPGEEGRVAALLSGEMKRAASTRSGPIAAGNVIGSLPGRRRGWRRSAAVHPAL